ncbi:MAG: hypothetical protein JWO82_66 [Akkermansiaceae bacterium]|nr:hypothetical protein [Akkermansiaceae bacterium]
MLMLRPWPAPPVPGPGPGPIPLPRPPPEPPPPPPPEPELLAVAARFGRPESMRSSGLSGRVKEASLEVAIRRLVSLETARRIWVWTLFAVWP